MDVATENAQAHILEVKAEKLENTPEIEKKTSEVKVSVSQDVKLVAPTLRVEVLRDDEDGSFSSGGSGISGGESSDPDNQVKVKLNL